MVSCAIDIPRKEWSIGCTMEPEEKAASDKDRLPASIAGNSSIIYVTRYRLQSPGAKFYSEKAELPKAIFQHCLYFSEEAC